jgi:hypothetical protein
MFFIVFLLQGLESAAKASSGGSPFGFMGLRLVTEPANPASRMQKSHVVGDNCALAASHIVAHAHSKCCTEWLSPDLWQKDWKQSSILYA